MNTGSESPERTTSKAPSLRTRLLSVLLALVLVAGFVWALSGQWDEVLTALRGQRPLVLLGSFALCLVAVFMSFLLWRGVLGALGSPVSVGLGAKIFFVAQLGKYLPGSLWPVVAQMKLGQQAGIPRQRMGLAFVLTLGLSIGWGLLIGLVALPALLTASGRGEAGWAWPFVLLLLVPLVAVLLTPRALNAVLNRGLRLIRRPALEQRLTAGQITQASLWTVAFWLVFGLHVWLLVVGLGAEGWHVLPAAIGGFALAFSLGPLLVVLPAGAGVREAALVVMLLPVLDVPEATAVAFTSRGLLMLTDGVLALGAAPALRRTTS